MQLTIQEKGGQRNSFFRPLLCELTFACPGINSIVKYVLNSLPPSIVIETSKETGVETGKFSWVRRAGEINKRVEDGSSRMRFGLSKGKKGLKSHFQYVFYPYIPKTLQRMVEF